MIDSRFDLIERDSGLLHLKHKDLASLTNEGADCALAVDTQPSYVKMMG